MNQTPTESKTEPTNTLYISNLNDKIPLNKLHENLYILFSTYGLIIQMNVHAKIKGQAFITFSDENEAKLSLRSLQGEKLFGKELKLAFSRNENHIISKKDQ
ncbi:hypothetical protein WICPIJ_002114 [Wickerhamomyces pijperi]|uniref:RRM domain-containing protein n=1 Tax=Wickerhamomyces pijperi TaxID=599730 RepID=A0A9P8QC14_WICPI|nr:hypothetical protein WICPIJ_002114 [Wickerhamomyces pijperi]